MPFIDGFLVGFAMVVFVGPVLFTILQISLEKGKKPGLSSAFGVFISDLICVIICYYSTNKFSTELENSIWISLLGSVILFSIGLKYIIKPNLNVNTIDESTKSSLFNSFSKGFLINFVNPFVFGVWIAVIGLAKQKYNLEIDLLIYLFAATFAILITDSLKVIFADYLRKFLQPTLLSKIYKISGVLLILFGVRIIVHIL